MVSVTVRRRSASVDDLGDATDGTPVETTYSDALFEPQQFVERTDSRSPGVTSVAKVYLLNASLALDSDDEVVVDGVTWRVVGGSSAWGLGTEVPVERTGEV